MCNSSVPYLWLYILQCHDPVLVLCVSLRTSCCLGFWFVLAAFTHAANQCNWEDHCSLLVSHMIHYRMFKSQLHCCKYL